MSELVNKVYLEAVRGIEEDWLANPNSRWYDYIVNLPIRLQVVYMIVVFHNQVFNGGFHQYFVNGYGQFVGQTIKYLKEINASEKAGLLEKALAIVNYKNLDMDIFRHVLLNRQLDKLFVTDELFNALEELDDNYYDSKEEIEELLNSYLERTS